MLKKAGIVATMAIGGVLVMTPLASAQEAAPAQVSNNCPSAQVGPTITSTGGLISVIAPVTTQVSALNCVGLSLSNLVNVNSGNTTTTVTRNSIRNSFNWALLFRR